MQLILLNHNRVKTDNGTIAEHTHDSWLIKKQWLKLWNTEIKLSSPGENMENTWPLSAAAEPWENGKFAIHQQLRGSQMNLKSENNLVFLLPYNCQTSPSTRILIHWGFFDFIEMFHRSVRAPTTHKTQCERSPAWRKLTRPGCRILHHTNRSVHKLALNTVSLALASCAAATSLANSRTKVWKAKLFLASKGSHAATVTQNNLLFSLAMPDVTPFKVNGSYVWGACKCSHWAEVMASGAQKWVIRALNTYHQTNLWYNRFNTTKFCFDWKFINVALKAVKYISLRPCVGGEKYVFVCMSWHVLRVRNVAAWKSQKLKSCQELYIWKMKTTETQQRLI